MTKLIKAFKNIVNKIKNNQIDFIENRDSEFAIPVKSMIGFFNKIKFKALGVEAVPAKLTVGQSIKVNRDEISRLAKAGYLFRIGPYKYGLNSGFYYSQFKGLDNNINPDLLGEYKVTLYNNRKEVEELLWQAVSLKKTSKLIIEKALRELMAPVYIDGTDLYITGPVLWGGNLGTLLIKNKDIEYLVGERYDLLVKAGLVDEGKNIISDYGSIEYHGYKLDIKILPEDGIKKYHHGMDLTDLAAIAIKEANEPFLRQFKVMVAYIAAGYGEEADSELVELSDNIDSIVLDKIQTIDVKLKNYSFKGKEVKISTYFETIVKKEIERRVLKPLSIEDNIFITTGVSFFDTLKYLELETYSHIYSKSKLYKTLIDKSYELYLAEQVLNHSVEDIAHSNKP